ncbi:hypothetical protein [Mycobacterium talmoniae]|uniref:Secreted protein n=1 Tax=Mycobacterium talmoniae TaxID=1858794 RepID=A0A1S1NGA7_9MYCO|nr:MULTISPECIES: hypothetical protein [Mycobacterium]OHV00588.1 hypothetical protein BKN37_17820 [Mycobacterium talmoniae]PQM49278.1 hypothetical protein C1Y40_00491 [Mycobacterium talmoniae]TDH56031.1 hypothetical protein E2F47_09065 [Mycobacterium eburneum]
MRRAVIAAVVVLASLGSAIPARADEVIEGVYTYTQDGVAPQTWTITPLCVPVVGDGRVPLELPVGCKLQVNSTAANTGSFQLVGGRWTYSTTAPHGFSCPDGSTAPTTETYSFDDSLNGTYSSAHNEVCGSRPAIARHPFTLTFVAPLPNPVSRYPLNCQDNPQHLCS